MAGLPPDITSLLEKAAQFQTAGKYDAAIYFYSEAAEDVLEAIQERKLDASYRTRAEGFITAAEHLKNLQSEQNLNQPKSEQQLQIDRAEFLLYQALNEDEDGNSAEAAQLYLEAIEGCLKVRKDTKNVNLQEKMSHLAAQALDRAEALKRSKPRPKVQFSADERLEMAKNSRVPGINILSDGTDDASPSNVPSHGDTLRLPIVPGGFPGSRGMGDDGSVSPNTKRKLASVGSEGYTPEELNVLKSTSSINGRHYVPFMSVDLKERFAYPDQFSDSHGKLALSDKQKSRFSKWARPSEFLDKPTVIQNVDSDSIKQTVVSDCSFIASLAISARYEKRFNKKLVTRIIYPQNKNGDPVFNPCGKYMIKFHINGINRKIIIDDYLPMGRHGELLCSYSNDRNELWVSLLEKAYMKVMGGYDFPGSNSNIDLSALTGWIPERIAIRLDSPEFNKDEVFEKLFSRFHRGDCLITLATGQIAQAEADRAGLVDCHAYAMLDIRKIKGLRLFQLKNPWNHLRWKGRYSDKDVTNWTPELMKALSYDPHSAQQHDDGVFYIDYDSLCRFYDVIYINWNPALFAHTYCYHSAWNAGLGPAKDLYTISDNPQYKLEVNNTSDSAAVWILLTRHITDKDDFANNKEYITVLVYKTGGKRVFYPFDPPPFIDGTRINSPHYLCKMTVTDRGVQPYTLVVSQYEKSKTICYTLRVYSTVPFKLSKIQKDFKHKKKETGEWKGKTAGGCANYRETYGNNPLYQFNLEDEQDVLIDIKGPKQYSVGLDVIQVSSKSGTTYTKQTTKAFRSGYAVLELEQVPAGVYNIMPQTFRPALEGPFILSVQSDSSFQLKRIQ